MRTLLTVDAAMEILRTTVPRLEALTANVPAAHLTAVTGYGWSVSQQLAHLRSCHDILGGNLLRILREDHPAWKGRSPRSNQGRYMALPFEENFGAFRTMRADLLAVLDPAPAAAWERTATVADMVKRTSEVTTLYYADWMARHERGHVRHIATILGELAAG